MKKTLRKSLDNRSLALITKTVLEQAQYQTESKGVIKVIKNYCVGTVSDLRQLANNIIFGTVGYCIGNYYSAHRNDIWIAAFLGVLIMLPISFFARMFWIFWRDRKNAYNTGGILAVRNVQFNYGLDFAGAQS